MFPNMNIKRWVGYARLPVTLAGGPLACGQSPLRCAVSVNAHWDLTTLVRANKEKKITKFSKRLHVKIQYTLEFIIRYH